MPADLTHALEVVARGLGATTARLEWAVGENMRVGSSQAPLEAALRDAVAAVVAGAPQGARVTVTADRETESCVVRLRTDYPLSLDGMHALESVAESAGGFLAASPSGFVARIPRA
ncbi:MAG TPA: hypothetical protein VM241_05560 [Candidatus Thermoplasmatota archaeon]|nr:hypothetical protein [Candidatus Thermoplasmatota archaeon]